MHVHTLVYVQDSLTNGSKTISTRHQQLIGVCGGTCAGILFLYMYLCQLFYLLLILFVGTNITFLLDLHMFGFGESPPRFEFFFLVCGWEMKLHSREKLNFCSCQIYFSQLVTLKLNYLANSGFFFVDNKRA